MTDKFKSNHCCYSYMRMRSALVRPRLQVSQKVVQRLMKQECLRVTVNERRWYAPYLGEIRLASQNIINRDVQADAPNAKW